MKTYLLFLFLFIGSFTLSAQVTLKARVYLEGALMNNGNALSSTGKPLMRDNLRLSPFTSATYIPMSDPYKFGHPNFDITARYNHVPPNQPISQHQIQDAAVLAVSGDNAIVDWVFVELRSPDNATQILGTRSCLVQRDGDIVDLDGVSPVAFPNTSGTQFYVAIRHRNHLGAMCMPADINQTIDFTSPNTAMFDFGEVSATLNYTGLAQNKDVMPNYRALYGGDFNGDGIVKANGSNDDQIVLMYDVIFHSSNSDYRSVFDSAVGYYNSDFNLNSKSKFDNPFDDTNLLYGQIYFYPNNAAFIANFSAIIEQIP